MKNELKNVQLSVIEKKIRNKSIVEIIDLIENDDDDFIDIYTMLRDLEIEYENIKDIYCVYFQGNEMQFIGGQEHSSLHEIFSETDKIDYARNIPPVVRVLSAGIYLGNDGNHRCNTCFHHQLKLPVVIIEIQKEK